MSRGRSQGLRGVRLLLTLSSLSPLFVLLPLKYQEVCMVFPTGKLHNLCEQPWFGLAAWVGTVAALVGIPFVGLQGRITAARRGRDEDNLLVQSAEDKREHLVAYLFAVLLPLYQTEADTWPSLLALLFSVAFVIWLFQYLGVYYVNPYFAVRGYRTFLIKTPPLTQQGAHSGPAFLITRRTSIQPQERITALRLGDGVYLEEQ